MAVAPGDVSQATVTHWLLAPWDYSYNVHSQATSVPSSVKRPLENRIWYAYPDEDSTGTFTGSWIEPTAIARVLDDGTTQSWQGTYNGQGYPTSGRDPLGRQTSAVYATNGIDLLEVRQTTGGMNDVLATFGSYTAQHRPQTITNAAGQTSTATYNGFGQPLTATNAKSETATYAYDTNGYLQSVTGPVSGATTTLTYDAYGRPRTVTGSDGYATTTDYDALDRPTRVTYPDGTYDSLVYNRLDAEQRRDRLGRTTRMFYDPVRHLTATRDPLGRAVTQQWCACGSLDKLIDAKGQTTTWERDVQNRVTREVRADGTTATVSTYETTTSRPKTVTDPKGQVSTYTYALDDALTQVAYANTEHATPTVSYTYETNYPRLATMVDGTGTTTYTYKAVGALGATKLANVDGPLTNDTVTYDYDELGRPTSRSVNSVAVSQAYDALDRVTGQTNVLGTFTYDYIGVSGRLATVSYPNGQSTTFDYETNAGDQRLKDIHNRLSGGATLSKFTYTTDVMSRVTTWQQQAGASAATIDEFGYDSADQLTSAVRRTTDATPTILKRYADAYDVAGNRVSEQIDDAIAGATYDSRNQLTSQQPIGNMVFAGTVSEAATVSIAGKPAAVSATNTFSGTAPVTAGTTVVIIAATDGSGNTTTAQYEVDVSGATHTLTYDANGNLTSDGTRSLTWDAADRLLSVTMGTKTSEFTYDGFDRRVRIVEKDGGVTTSDKRFVWCGLEICEERDATGGTVTKRFFGQGVQEGGASYYITRDHLGSVRELTDSAGTLRARYDYDSWGRRTKLTGDKDADFGFTGHYEHAPSALTLALYRVYDTNLGRWICEDPLGMPGGVNLFGYAGNNPMNLVDHFGLCEEQSRDSPSAALEAAIRSGNPNEIRLVLEVNPYGVEEAERQLALKAIQRLESKAIDVIAKELKGSVAEVFPEELKTETVAEIFRRAGLGNKAAQTARKILTSNKYKK